jgi:hypothetical protein
VRDDPHRAPPIAGVPDGIGLSFYHATFDGLRDGGHVWRVEPGAIECCNANTEWIVSGSPKLAAELAKRKAEGAARLAWWRRERRRQTAVKVRAGFYRTEREMEAAWKLFHVADRQVAQVAATSWAGVVTKLHLFQKIADGGEIDDDLVPSAIADAERLLADGGAA